MDHLKCAFTIIALKYLWEKNQDNVYVDMLEYSHLIPKWTDPDFELDGLIYDKTANIFYIVETKVNLTEAQVTKTEVTSKRFYDFVMNEPTKTTSKIVARRWEYFFGEDGVIKLDIGTKPTIFVFIAFHTSSSEIIIASAKSKGFMLIGPTESFYKVI